MSGLNEIFSPVVMGGRRSGINRRLFSYTLYIPERRSSKDRRSGQDRRSDQDHRDVINFRMVADQKVGVERRAAF